MIAYLARMITRMTGKTPTPVRTCADTDTAFSAAITRSTRTPVVVDAATACGYFLDHLRHQFGAGEMLWRTVYVTYVRIAADEGWPRLSEKALSQGLSTLGCTSRQRDLRKWGQGRPRELVWHLASNSRQVAA